MISNHYIKTWLEITISIPLNKKGCLGYQVHPGRLTWNLKTTQLKRKIIFQTIIFRFHVNLPGCTHYRPSCFGLKRLQLTEADQKELEKWGDGSDRVGWPVGWYLLWGFHPRNQTRRRYGTTKPGKSDSVSLVKCGNITYLLVACLERFGLFEVWYFRKLFFWGGKVSGLDRVW